MAPPSRKGPQADRQPTVDKPVATGPEGPEHEVVVALRISADFVATFTFRSPDDEHVVIHELHCELVTKNKLASLTQDSIRFSDARRQAYFPYHEAGKDHLIVSLVKPGARGPRSLPEEDWVRRAVEYVEAAERERQRDWPRKDIYREMSEAFPGKSSQTLRTWVAKCREKRLITPAPEKKLTDLGEELKRKYRIQPWAPAARLSPPD